MSENLVDFLSGYIEFGPYAFLSNLSGNPAISLPLHWTYDNSPIWVQFVGRYSDENDYLKLPRI